MIVTIMRQDNSKQLQGPTQPPQPDKRKCEQGTEGGKEMRKGGRESSHDS